MNHIDCHGRDNAGCGCRQQQTPMPIPVRPCHDTVPTEHNVMPLAMAYVHVQSLGALYDPCTALIAGTVFPDLDKPFCGAVISSSAYPTPPARTCSCSLPAQRGGCMRGGACRE